MAVRRVITTIAGAVMAMLLSALGFPFADSGSIANPRYAIFVANFGGNCVTLYPVGSNGNVAPVATIDGAATTLTDPKGIALDSKANIFVLNVFVNYSRPRDGASITEFAAGSRGNVSPIATIAGPRTLLRSVQSISVDSNDNIYVGAGEPAPPGVRVFAAKSNGDVIPRANIAGPETGLQNTFGLATDLNGRLFTANDSGNNKYNVFIFPDSGDGNMKPGLTIGGSETGLESPAGVALDSRGNIYVANAGRYNYGSNVPASIRVFAYGSRGNVAPIATIVGSDTGLDGRTLRGIALDSEGNVYVTSDRADDGETSSITVFAAGSNGNVKPMAVIAGANTRLFGAGGVAIGPYEAGR
jgi:hypothetical protein